MRLRLALLVLALALVALPFPAAAESWSAGDPRRDVSTFSFEEEPEPCGTFTEVKDPKDATTDLVRLGVRHSRATVRVALAFRDLDGTSQHSTQLYLRTSTGEFEVSVDRSEAWGETWVDLSRMPDYEAAAEDADECGAFIIGSSARSCPDLEADLDPAADRLVVLIPRPCLREPRWVRVAANVSTWRGEGTEIAGSSDRWQPKGTKASTRVDGPYGPRVRVD